MTTTLLIVARALSFGSGMILVGVMAFRWFVLLPAFAGATDETGNQLGSLGRQLRRLFFCSAIVLVLSGVFLFWAVAAEMSDRSLGDALDRETLATVLFQTQFGTVCLWRIGFASILLGTTLYKQSVILSLPPCAAPKDQFSFPDLIASVTAVALVISMAWTGHAAASSSFFLLRIAADALHLLAAAIWPAGLLPFALFLRCASISPPMLAAIRRFSALSLFIVFVVILTGIINSIFFVGSFSALVSTEYGRILCLKLALFLVIMGIAYWNRFRLLPLLADQPHLNVIRQLRTFVLLEFGLAAVIVLVVSFLGITPPSG